MSSGEQSDRRAGLRVMASLPILFEWQALAGELCRVRGTTHDVSLGGVYCYLEQPLAPGLPVLFHVVFPAELDASESLNFHCTGSVLRTASLGRRFGVAASIESRQAIETGAGEYDRRFRPRVMPFASIPVHYLGHHLAIRDLSPAGAFIEDERPLPVARTVDMVIGGAGVLAEVSVRAIVRRSEPHNGMAVEFVAVGKEANDRLQHFVGMCTRKRAS